MQRPENLKAGRSRKKDRAMREADARAALERVTKALATVGVSPDGVTSWPEIVRDFGRFVDAGVPCQGGLSVPAAGLRVTYRLSTLRGTAPDVEVLRGQKR